MSKPHILNDGDSLLFTKNSEFLFFGCCDCELTHRVDVKITKKGMELFFHHDERRTSQRRRRKQESVNLGKER